MAMTQGRSRLDPSRMSTLETLGTLRHEVICSCLQGGLSYEDAVFAGDAEYGEKIAKQRAMDEENSKRMAEHWAQMAQVRKESGTVTWVEHGEAPSRWSWLGDLLPF